MTVVGDAASAQVLASYTAAGTERWIHAFPIFDNEGELQAQIGKVLAIQSEFTGAP